MATTLTAIVASVILWMGCNAVMWWYSTRIPMLVASYETRPTGCNYDSAHPCVNVYLVSNETDKNQPNEALITSWGASWIYTPPNWPIVSVLTSAEKEFPKGHHTTVYCTAAQSPHHCITTRPTYNDVGSMAFMQVLIATMAFGLTFTIVKPDREAPRQLLLE